MARRDVQTLVSAKKVCTCLASVLGWEGEDAMSGMAKHRRHHMYFTPFGSKPEGNMSFTCQVSGATLSMFPEQTSKKKIKLNQHVTCLRSYYCLGPTLELTEHSSQQCDALNRVIELLQLYLSLQTHRQPNKKSKYVGCFLSIAG